MGSFRRISSFLAAYPVFISFLKIIYNLFTLHQITNILSPIRPSERSAEKKTNHVSEEYIMDLNAKDKTQHPENVELLSAQKPITDFKGLLTTIISAVVCFGIYYILPYSPDANKGIALLILLRHFGLPKPYTLPLPR